MQKHRKKRQLNNEGFSLVELLIACDPLNHCSATAAQLCDIGKDQCKVPYHDACHGDR